MEKALECYGKQQKKTFNSKTFHMKTGQKETKPLRLTNEQLAERLAGKSCCGKEMILAETHQESGNKVCLKYVCSQCNSSLFTYGEKPKKSITLTPRQYESLLTEMKTFTIYYTKRKALIANSCYDRKIDN